MRFVAIAAATVLLVPCTHAYGANEKLPDAQALLMLEAKADQASPKEQCFLYAEIVHDMTEIAGQEMAAESAKLFKMRERLREFGYEADRCRY